MLPKLSREEVITMIKENDSPDGLKLSEYDLSGVSLSELDLSGVIFGTDWRTPHLNKACLTNARLDRCQLKGASFIHTDLSGVSFFGSNLQDAIIGVANCTDTSFRKANLKNVNFHAARLINADFLESDLRWADFHTAYIADIDLTRATVGDKLLFDDEEKYMEFLEKHIIEEETVNEFFAKRFLASRQARLLLKNAYLNKGQYDEASEAYIKERQAEKRTHWPSNRAICSYPKEYESISKSGSKRLWQLSRFHIGHFTSYIVDSIIEYTCGYGEKPLRSLWWALFTVIGFSILYRVSGTVVTVNNIPMTWVDYLNYSLGAFTTMSYENFTTVNSFGQALTSLEALSGISLLALLMFALGNRISRS